MEKFNVEDLGIDVRRFASFGVVKVRAAFWIVIVFNTTDLYVFYRAF